VVLNGRHPIGPDGIRRESRVSAAASFRRQRCAYRCGSVHRPHGRRLGTGQREIYSEVMARVTRKCTLCGLRTKLDGNGRLVRHMVARGKRCPATGHYPGWGPRTAVQRRELLGLDEDELRALRARAAAMSKQEGEKRRSRRAAPKPGRGIKIVSGGLPTLGKRR
jgi:hypothetical protein